MTSDGGGDDGDARSHDGDSLGVSMTPELLKHLCRAASQPTSPLATTQLYLNCQRFKTISTDIKRYPAAESLWLERNRIKHIEHLEHLKELKTVFLHGNQIEEIGSSLKNLTKLRVLSLSNNRIAKLEYLPSSISVLLAAENRISTPDGFKGVAISCPKLQELDLGKNQLEDVDGTITAVCAIANLHSLTLKGNPVANAIDPKNTKRIKIPHYRKVLTSMLPRLGSLDGQGIRVQERRYAELWMKGALEDAAASPPPTAKSGGASWLMWRAAKNAIALAAKKPSSNTTSAADTAASSTPPPSPPSEWPAELLTHLVSYLEQDCRVLVSFAASCRAFREAARLRVSQMRMSIAESRLRLSAEALHAITHRVQEALPAAANEPMFRQLRERKHPPENGAVIQLFHALLLLWPLVSTAPGKTRASRPAHSANGDDVENGDEAFVPELGSSFWRNRTWERCLGMSSQSSFPCVMVNTLPTKLVSSLTNPSDAKAFRCAAEDIGKHLNAKRVRAIQIATGSAVIDDLGWIPPLEHDDFRKVKNVSNVNGGGGGEACALLAEYICGVEGLVTCVEEWTMARAASSTTTRPQEILSPPTPPQKKTG